MEQMNIDDRDHLLERSRVAVAGLMDDEDSGAGVRSRSS
jgi:hypothetical protein